MSVYLIIQAHVTDAQKFGPYARQAPALMERHGGRYRVLGGRQELLEGEDGGARVVVSEWPSREAVMAFWNSPEYAALKRLRKGTGTFEVRLVEGVQQ